MSSPDMFRQMNIGLSNGLIRFPDILQKFNTQLPMGRMDPLRSPLQSA